MGDQTLPDASHKGTKSERSSLTTCNEVFLSPTQAQRLPTRASAQRRCLADRRVPSEGAGLGAVSIAALLRFLPLLAPGALPSPS